MRARFEGDLDEYFFICLQNSFLLFWNAVVRPQNHADILITFQNPRKIYIRINADAQNSSKSSASKKVEDDKQQANDNHIISGSAVSLPVIHSK